MEQVDGKIVFNLEISTNNAKQQKVKGNASLKSYKTEIEAQRDANSSKSINRCKLEIFASERDLNLHEN